MSVSYLLANNKARMKFWVKWICMYLCVCVFICRYVYVYLDILVLYAKGYMKQ